jgi:hypothetical protein
MSGRSMIKYDPQALWPVILGDIANGASLSAAIQ